jgi:hypothetical protein
MASTASSIAGFAVCLGITWGLLLYGELPAEVAPTSFVQPLTSPQFTWVAKIWFLINYILLDAQPGVSTIQLVVLTVIPWLVCGVTVGILSRNASRGFATGFLAMVVSIIIGWIIMVFSTFLGIALPEGGALPSVTHDPVQYLLTIVSFQAIGFGIVSGAGGAIGGALTPKRE